MVRVVVAFCMICAVLVSTVHTAAMVKPSIEKAEEHVLELAQHLDDIKNAVQPKHCNDILNGGQRTSGIYTIFHKAAGPSGQTVYCDMDVDGGGWTVIQQRGQFGNNVYYFYRNWTEYAEGFGVPAKEFWIGNRALHALTSEQDDMMLRVVLTNTTEDQKFVDYDSVKVANEDNFFQLQLGKFVGPSGWDALSNANGQNFSTFDSDNDAHPEENCALHYRGAWWYNRCHLANLNGLNLNGEHESFADGIEWSVRGHPSRFYRYSYPRVRMMIRPVETPLELRSLAVAPPASP